MYALFSHVLSESESESITEAMYAELGMERKQDVLY